MVVEDVIKAKDGDTPRSQFPPCELFATWPKPSFCFNTTPLPCLLTVQELDQTGDHVKVSHGQSFQRWGAPGSKLKLLWQKTWGTTHSPVPARWSKQFPSTETQSFPQRPLVIPGKKKLPPPLHSLSFTSHCFQKKKPGLASPWTTRLSTVHQPVLPHLPDKELTHAPPVLLPIPPSQGCHKSGGGAGLGAGPFTNCLGSS
jgi:hypothetical protein